MHRVILAMALLTPSPARAEGLPLDLGVRATDPTFDLTPDAESRSAGALVDWYPKLGGFRLSGGVRVNGNSMDLASMPNAPVQGRLAGTVEFNRFAPYLGIGWQGAMMGGRMLIGLDLGALYQGRPDVQLAANPGPAEEVARDARAIEDTLSGLAFSPVVSLSFTYRF